MGLSPESEAVYTDGVLPGHDVSRCPRVTKGLCSMDLWPAIDAEQRMFVVYLRGLPDEAWTRPSLVTGWPGGRLAACADLPGLQTHRA